MTNISSISSPVNFAPHVLSYAQEEVKQGVAGLIPPMPTLPSVRSVLSASGLFDAKNIGMAEEVLKTGMDLGAGLIFGTGYDLLNAGLGMTLGINTLGQKQSASDVAMTVLMFGGMLIAPFGIGMLGAGALHLFRNARLLEVLEKGAVRVVDGMSGKIAARMASREVIGAEAAKKVKNLLEEAGKDATLRFGKLNLELGDGTVQLSKTFLNEHGLSSWDELARVLVQNGVQAHAVEAGERMSLPSVRGLALSHATVVVPHGPNVGRVEEEMKQLFACTSSKSVSKGSGVILRGFVGGART